MLPHNLALLLKPIPNSAKTRESSPYWSKSLLRNFSTFLSPSIELSLPNYTIDVLKHSSLRIDYYEMGKQVKKYGAIDIGQPYKMEIGWNNLFLSFFRGPEGELIEFLELANN